MRVILGLLLAGFLLVSGSVTADEPQASNDGPAMTPKRDGQYAWICFKSDEHPSGTSRVCRYDCAGSPASLVTSIAQTCPLAIER